MKITNYLSIKYLMNFSFTISYSDEIISRFGSDSLSILILNCITLRLSH